MIEIIEYIKNPEISAVILTVLFAIVGKIFQPKSKVLWGASHQFCSGIPQKDSNILLLYTRSIFIKNMGKADAKNVRIYFNFKPEHYQIWPAIKYSESKNPEGHFIVHFDNLPKGEPFNLEIIQAKDEPPALLRVEAENGKCKFINMGVQIIYPKWVNYLMLTLLGLGIYKLMEWTLRASI